MQFEWLKIQKQKMYLRPSQLIGNQPEFKDQLFSAPVNPPESLGASPEILAYNLRQAWIHPIKMGVSISSVPDWISASKKSQ